jgi:hypothetical protein
MNQISIVLGTHKEQPIIKILFDYDKALVERIKKYPKAVWSKSMQCWYVPDTEVNRKQFNLALKKEVYSNDKISAYNLQQLQ